MPTLPVETQPISALPQLQQPRDGHRYDAILVGEAGAGGGVVLEVEVAQAQLRPQPVGVDQGRVAGVAPDARLRGGVDDRQQLLEVPDVLGALGVRDLSEMTSGQLVVVDDVKPLAAVRTREHRVGQRIVVLAAVAGQTGRARARPRARESDLRSARPVSVNGSSAWRVDGVLASSCRYHRGYARPRRLCVAIVTERDPQLLGDVRRERREHLREHRQGVQQRVAVGRAQLLAAREDTFLDSP